jgi:hypothetical protein
MPYATVWVSGESGWDIVVPDELPVLSPGETAPMMLNITPPDTAQHGRAVELHVKLREGDGSGATEITLPLRVAIINDFDLSGKGPWFISDDGGHPIAELQNLGNAPTTIALQVLSLPSGWIVVGQTEVVLGVGEIRGVPLEVIPSADWDGSAQTVRILAEDADGNQREVSLNTEQSSYSWASSPVIVVMMGDHALLQIHGTTSASSVVDSESGQLQWDDRGGWALPAVASVNGSLSVDSSSLDYVSHVVEPSLRSAECEILGSFEEVVAYCSIFNGTEPFSYSILLIDDRGAMLNSASGHVPANSPYGPINLSAEGWSPEPGSRTLTLRLLDERGFQVAIDEAGFQVRRSDWNIGVVELELDGEGSNQEVKVLTRRTNHQLLTDADCHLSLVAGEHSSTHQVDWSSTLAPIFRIDRPDVDDGIEIVVTIGCEFPWDSDSDPSDDEARLILSGGSMELPEFDMGTAVVAALLVIGASVAFAWMLRNYREDKELMEMAMAAAEERAAKKSIEPKAPDTPEPVAETQDEGISEDAAEPESEVEEGALDEFEDRLGRLMRED